MDRKQLRAIDPIMRQFGQTMGRLVEKLAARNPHEPNIGRLRDRMRLATSADPFAIIDAVGPYLMRFSGEIINRDAQFFVDHEYGAELAKAHDTKAEASHIIALTKTAYQTSSEKEQSQYMDTIQDLLETYINYLTIRNG